MQILLFINLVWVYRLVKLEVKASFIIYYENVLKATLSLETVWALT